MFADIFFQATGRACCRVNLKGRYDNVGFCAHFDTKLRSNKVIIHTVNNRNFTFMNGVIVICDGSKGMLKAIDANLITLHYRLRVHIEN